MKKILGEHRVGGSPHLLPLWIRHSRIVGVLNIIFFSLYDCSLVAS